MRAIYSMSRYIIIAATGGIFALASGTPGNSAALSEKSSWLLGNFTQNAPCKGDGSDPAELKVRIAASPRSCEAQPPDYRARQLTEAPARRQRASTVGPCFVVPQEALALVRRLVVAGMRSADARMAK